MDEFYKNIKDDLNNMPEPAFQEEDWDSLSKQLDGTTTTKKSIWKRFWWAPILLLLLGSQTYLLCLWTQAQHDLEQIKIDNQAVTIDAPIHIFQDTILLTNTIYKYDTIYLTGNTVRQSLKAAQNQANSGGNRLFFSSKIKQLSSQNTRAGYSQALDLSHQNNSFGITRNEILSLDFIHSNQQAPLLTEALNKTSNAEYPDKESIGVQAYMPLLSLTNISKSVSIDPLERYFHNRSLAPIVRKTKRPGPFDEFGPQGFMLEGSIGYNIKHHDVINYKNEFVTQLKTSVKLSSSLDFWLDASLTGLSYEVDQMDSEFGVPPVSPPSANFEFVLAEANRPVLMYSAGIQYTHVTGTRLRPFIGIGLNATNTFAYDLIYEFNDITGPDELNIERAISAEFNFADYAVFNAGIKYALSDQWRAHLRGSYYHNILKEFNPSIYSVQVGLGYSF